MLYFKNTNKKTLLYRLIRIKILCEMLILCVFLKSQEYKQIFFGNRRKSSSSLFIPNYPIHTVSQACKFSNSFIVELILLKLKISAVCVSRIPALQHYNLMGTPCLVNPKSIFKKSTAQLCQGGLHATVITQIIYIKIKKHPETN